MPGVVLGLLVFTAVLTSICLLLSALATTPNLAAILWCLMLGGTAAVGRVAGELTWPTGIERDLERVRCRRCFGARDCWCHAARNQRDWLMRAARRDRPVVGLRAAPPAATTGGNRMSSQPPPLETQSSAPPSALLTFANVSKWYGQVSALMDISFAVRGEVVGLVGRNGAGKSTLMKLASGLLRPSEGQVLVCGDDAAIARARAQLGFCPDLDRLYERQTGREFVAWMLRLPGASAAAARQRAGTYCKNSDSASTCIAACANTVKGCASGFVLPRHLRTARRFCCSMSR